MPIHSHQRRESADDRLTIPPQFTQPGEVQEIPRNRLSGKGMLPSTAYQLIHDELLLDGSSRLNLATFVTTWMEPEAERLMAECSSKNMIDKDEYPQTAELERRCVNILADLWHATPEETAVGCSTTGSSEACMLGGLALKWRWRQRRQVDGKPHDRPNLVMGANVQVCWEKFCRYWDVECRLAKVGPVETHLTANQAVELCDENTIGVVAVLGSTYDGSYEPVAEIAAALDKLQAETGYDIPIHVDGASGGFIAPFLDPDLQWDFRIPRVHSINASGHKYGLVYPGVGWVVWRDEASLPEDLIFRVAYLGGDMPTFALNFSRPGAQIVAQYYNFLRLGFDGYRRIQQASRDTATWLAGQIESDSPFSVLRTANGIPAFAFRLAETRSYTVFDVSEALRARGWQVPAYMLPPDMDDIGVLRVVVRNGFSRDMAGMLLTDLRTAVKRLEHYGGLPADDDTEHHKDTRAGFRH